MLVIISPSIVWIVFKLQDLFLFVIFLRSRQSEPECAKFNFKPGAGIAPTLSNFTFYFSPGLEALQSFTSSQVGITKLRPQGWFSSGIARRLPLAVVSSSSTRSVMTPTLLTMMMINTIFDT